MDNKYLNLADRTNVFYWQTDRDITPEEAGEIWADRHRYFTDDEIVTKVNDLLKQDKLISLNPLNTNDQTSLGNVNSVRVGRLETGKEIIIRCHPKGIPNGYFHAESAAAHAAKISGLPSYDTLAIHDYTENNDFAFQVIEKLPGTAIKKYLAENPDNEAGLLPNIGQMMARLHQIKVGGFGPFDNEQSKKTGELLGLHSTLGKAMRAGLAFNLEILTKEGLIVQKQIDAITELFADNNPLLACKQAVLVHNDFADWNLLTDGKNITGILDWDECVASDPVSDIACWSTFFDPARLGGFLGGYWQVANKPNNFEERFELFRLRYTLSKMTLRIRRYTWEPSQARKEKIETGKIHLAKSIQYFGI